MNDYIGELSGCALCYIFERPKDTFQNTLFRKTVSEDYPLACTQTTLNRMIMLPVSVINDRMRVRYCGDDDSV